uniref:Phospholipase A2-like central domain-containing protein n=1 Tax=Knipowitschia caucasica TaxID=637954 RepID=A0AAV2MRV3_KNICA
MRQLVQQSLINGSIAGETGLYSSEQRLPPAAERRQPPVRQPPPEDEEEANDYDSDEARMFEKADLCCREHDHCQHVIPAFTVNYGVFNPNFFTVSHCDCDRRFQQCLMDVNDTISSMVLYSFRMLKVPCIELKLQKRCTKINWWGM